MQIIIELSDETYKDIKEENSIYGINNGLSARMTGKVVGAIQNGKLLPKGHGRLIDAYDMKDIEFINKGDYNSTRTIREWIDSAPTVIEAADKEQE